MKDLEQDLPRIARRVRRRIETCRWSLVKDQRNGSRQDVGQALA
jgi:hypothetical protein